MGLYEPKPLPLLFHYTSLGALERIAREKCLWATDIHYFNDSAEMRHMVTLFDSEINQRIQAGVTHSQMLEQLRAWLGDRIPNGNMVFVTSFTENGNLLSQWRSYCAAGQGVSLALESSALEQCSREQSFQIGRCIYEFADQARVVSMLVDAIERLADLRREKNVRLVMTATI